MAGWEFWVLVALIVVGQFSILRWINGAENSITRKMDDVISELKAVNSKIDRS
jgi:hypothetical protein